MTTAAANSTTTGTLPANTLLRVLGASIVTITRDGAVVATQSTDRDNFIGPYPTETSYSVVAGGAAVDVSLKDGDGASEASVPATLRTVNNNTVLVGGGNSYPLPSNFLPRIQSTHDMQLGEPLSIITIPTPYGTETATSTGRYEFAYGTPVYCAQGFHGYKFWMVAAPYPTQAVGPLTAVPAQAYKYENPCIVASNDCENWVVPAGLSNPIATSMGLADTTSYYADPYIAFNEDYSKLYVTFMHTNQAGTNKTTLYVTETSNGVTWTTPIAIYNSTSTTFTPNSPSLFWNGSGWTCLVIDTRDGTGTFTVQKMTTSAAAPYSGWSAFGAVTMTHPLGFNWWHAHFIPLADGGIIGMAVDGGSAGGAVYSLQSFNAGSSFSVQPFTAWKSASQAGSFYRPSLCVCSDGVMQSLIGFFSRIGPVQDLGFHVQKARLVSGKTAKMVMDASVEDMVNRQITTPAGMLSNALIAWDSFNRTDTALGLGTSDGGLVWDHTGFNPLGIGTNRAYNTVVGSCMGLLTVPSQNFELSTVIETLGTEMYLTWNVQDGSNRYRFGKQDGGAAVFQKIVAGATSINKALHITFAAGDRFGVRREGKYMTFLHNGRVIDTYYDATFVDSPKLGLQASGATTGYFGQISVKPI